MADRFVFPTPWSLPEQNVGGEERAQDGQHNETPPQEPMIDGDVWRNRTTLGSRFSRFVLILLPPSFDRGIEITIPVVHFNFAFASGLASRSDTIRFVPSNLNIFSDSWCTKNCPSPSSCNLCCSRCKTTALALCSRDRPSPRPERPRACL